MALNECIALEESVFYSNRGVDAQLVERLSSLLDSYSCFTEQAMAPPFPASRSAHHHHQGKRYDHFRKKAPPPRAHPPRRVQPERQLTALLNKISKSNFDKVAKYIMETLSNLTIELVVGSILKKCQKQPCFIEIYVRLLQCLYDGASSEKKDQIRACLGEFTDYCVDKCPNEITFFTLDSEDYDDFCNNISLKSDALGKHKTLLALLLLDDDLIEHSIIKAQKYFDTLFERAKSIGEKYERNNDLHELVLEMVLDCSRCGRDDWSTELRAYFTNPKHMHDYSAKAKFKVMDAFGARHAR